MAGWKVGELAKQTGLTVRTLHHYEELGLLSPGRTEAGHRLYGTCEVKRLQRIVSLRQLGFTLAEIQGCLHDPDFSPRRLLELHLQRLGEQIALQQDLRQRLAVIAEHLDCAEEVSAQDFIDIIEGMVRVEKYYTPEQRDTIKERAEEVGQERIKQVEAEWPELMAQVQAEMDKGADPLSERVQELARRWMGLVHEFTGGDAGIAKSLNRMWSEEGEIHGVETAPVREMGAYIQKALEAQKTLTVNVHPIDVLSGLRASLNAPEDERMAVFCERVMEPLKPFFEGWSRQAPNAPKDPLETARRLGFYTPDLGVAQGLEALEMLARADSWRDCQEALQTAIQVLRPETHGVRLEWVLLSLALVSSKVVEKSQGYSGFGGMPGKVLVIVWPSPSNLPRLKAATVHEFNHNVRFSIEPWTPQTTVGQYMVAEGLAEAFAVELYGETVVGPYATALSHEQLEAVKPRFQEGLEVAGFNEIRGYIFGDWAAAEHGYTPKDIPDYAGYTVGYEVVRAFCRRTGKSVAEATYIPWREIVEHSRYFSG